MKNCLRPGTKCYRCGYIFKPPDGWEIGGMIGTAICLCCYSTGVPYGKERSEKYYLKLNGGIRMPSVKKGEKRNDYVSRAVPEMMKEGLTQRAAVGKAEGLFNSKWKDPKTHKGKK